MLVMNEGPNEQGSRESLFIILTQWTRWEPPFRMLYVASFIGLSNYFIPRCFSTSTSTNRPAESLVLGGPSTSHEELALSDRHDTERTIKSNRSTFFKVSSALRRILGSP